MTPDSLITLVDSTGLVMKVPPSPQYIYDVFFLSTCTPKKHEKTHMKMMVWKELTLLKNVANLFFTICSISAVFSPSLVRLVSFCSNLFLEAFVVVERGFQVSLASRLIKNGVKASWVSTQNTRCEALNPGGV